MYPVNLFHEINKMSSVFLLLVDNIASAARLLITSQVQRKDVKRKVKVCRKCYIVVSGHQAS